MNIHSQAGFNFYFAATPVLKCCTQNNYICGRNSAKLFLHIFLFDCLSDDLAFLGVKTVSVF